MKKIFFAGFVQLCIQTSLACTPGVAGTGPAGDPHCLLPMIHNDPYYNGSNPPPRKTKPKVIYIKKPDSWGALALTKSSGDTATQLYGHLDHESRTAAKKAAIKDCEAKSGMSCKYLMVWSNGCAAVAEGKNSKGLSSLFPNSKETAAEAEESVLGLCKKDGHTDCKIIVPAQCSLPK